MVSGVVLQSLFATFVVLVYIVVVAHEVRPLDPIDGVDKRRPIVCVAPM